MKVILEVYTSFVLQCTLGGNVNTRRISNHYMRFIFYIKKSMKYSDPRKLLCELSKLSKFNAFNLLGYNSSLPLGGRELLLKTDNNQELTCPPACGKIWSPGGRRRARWSGPPGPRRPSSCWLCCAGTSCSSPW